MNRVLIVTRHTQDAKALSEVLQNASDGPYAIEALTLLAPALVRIDSGEIDAILVDLNLADSQGIATFDQLFSAAPQIPILILSGTEEEELANLAVQRGAQGYLSKGDFESYLVPQSLRNIIQRKAVEESVFMEKARAEITLNSIIDAVIGTDINGNVDHLRRSALSLHDRPQGHSVHPMASMPPSMPSLPIRPISSDHGDQGDKAAQGEIHVAERLAALTEQAAEFQVDGFAAVQEVFTAFAE